MAVVAAAFGRLLSETDVRPVAAEPVTLVIFGGAGDLAHRKLLPALYNLHLDGLLPPRRARKMNKRLKRIRRAAGDSRDLDVLSARLKKNSVGDDSACRAKLQKFIARLRSAEAKEAFVAFFEKRRPDFTKVKEPAA